MPANLQKIYDLMWDNTLEKYNRGEFEYDHWLNSEEDKRYGITLLARPNEAIKIFRLNFAYS